MKHVERAAHIAREDYDATAHSPYLIADVVPLMGKRAKLTLTGTLVDCGQSRAQVTTACALRLHTQCDGCVYDQPLLPESAELVVVNSCGCWCHEEKKP